MRIIEVLNDVIILLAIDIDDDRLDRRVAFNQGAFERAKSTLRYRAGVQKTCVGNSKLGKAGWCLGYLPLIARTMLPSAGYEKRRCYGGNFDLLSGQDYILPLIIVSFTYLR